MPSTELKINSSKKAARHSSIDIKSILLSLVAPTYILIYVIVWIGLGAYVSLTSAFIVGGILLLPPLGYGIYKLIRFIQAKKFEKAGKIKINHKRSVVYSKRDYLFYGAMLALPILQIIIFYFVVNFKSFLMSFQIYDNVNGVYLWGQVDPSGVYKSGLQVNWEWFVSLLKGNDFWQFLGNSGMVWLFSTFAGLILALFFSYYIFKKHIAFNFFKFMLFMPSLLPVIFLATMFKNFIGDAVPSIAAFGFGIENMKNVFVDGTFFGEFANNAPAIVITLFSVWISFGAQVLVYTGAMEQIPSEVLEAAQLDGCSAMREFWSIILPYVIPSMSTFVIAGVAGIFTNRNNILSFLGMTEWNCKTLGYYIYYLVAGTAGSRSYWCQASFLGAILSVIGLALNLGVRRLLNGLTE